MNMRRFYLFGFLLLLSFDTVSQLSFKLAANHAIPLVIAPSWLFRVATAPWIYGAVLGYLGAFVTYMSLLRHAPVGAAFAASHLQVVSVILVSAWLFHERLSLAELLGSALIVGGILVLSTNKSDTRHADSAAALLTDDHPGS